MTVISMKKLLETGMHFGHRTGRWHPKMKPYIFTERNGIHIIDLQQTVSSSQEACDLIRDTVASGGEVLFVGTKRQAQDAIQNEAQRCNMPYVNRRWLGGMITNWRTMKERIDELERLESENEAGEWDSLKKKERLMLNRKIDKLQYRLGGIRSMHGLPRLMFVVDVRRESAAIKEANILNIPVIAMVDTNCDPSSVEYVLPANDDAIRGIRLMMTYMADAVLEGINLRKDEESKHEQGSDRSVDGMESIAESDEDLLGASTLAKLSSGELDFAGVPDDSGTIDKSESKTPSEVVDSIDTKPVDEDSSNISDDSALPQSESDIATADDVENSSSSKLEE
ncbi:MAG: 30S ribosomal protein S2 [Anaerolineales bacterium]